MGKGKGPGGFAGEKVGDISRVVYLLGSRLCQVLLRLICVIQKLASMSLKASASADYTLAQGMAILKTESNSLTMSF